MKTINEEALAERIAYILGQDVDKVQRTSFVSLMDQLVTTIEKMEEISKEQFETAKANGIPRKNVFQRYWDLGWEIERAITEPIRVGKNTDVWLQWKDIAIKNGVTNPTFNYRLKTGMSPERAATFPVNKRNVVETRIEV